MSHDNCLETWYYKETFRGYYNGLALSGTYNDTPWVCNERKAIAKRSLFVPCFQKIQKTIISPFQIQGY